MASVTNHPNGTKSVQFVAPGGLRKTIRLGRVSKTTAAAWKLHIGRLAEASKHGGTLAPDTVVWLRNLSDDFHEKLSDAELCESRHKATLTGFARAYEKKRPDWSSGSRTQFGLAVKDAEKHFGTDRRLDTITEADAVEFEAALKSRVATATMRKRLGYIKHVCRQAVRAGIITRNPFAETRTTNGGNRERLQYVSAAVAMRVAAELTGEKRLVFLLARFAGLRLPSEADALRLADVDFNAQTIRVRAKKTGQTRIIPMLPVLQAELLKAFERAEEGQEHVLQHRRKLPVLRRSIEWAAERAGIPMWPRVCQQLRSSFATDCARNLPSHIAAAALGHTTKIAAEHYWGVEQQDYLTAVEKLSGALQNALQQGAESGCTTYGEGNPNPVCDPVQPVAKSCNDKDLRQVGAAGFEPA